MIRLSIKATLIFCLSAWCYWYGRGVERHEQRDIRGGYSSLARRLLSERDACLEFLDEEPVKEHEIHVEEISI